MSNQAIKCSVSSCQHNDKVSYCTLRDITVGNSVTSEAKYKDETQCSSFSVS